MLVAVVTARLSRKVLYKKLTLKHLMLFFSKGTKSVKWEPKLSFFWMLNFQEKSADTNLIHYF